MAKKKKEDETELNSTIVTKLLGPSGLHPVPAWLPSGVFLLDLGIGQGYPAGHITEIFGDEGTGKTLLGLHACYEALLQSGDAVYFDAEGRVDISLVSGYVGINPEDSGFDYYPSNPNNKFSPWTVEDVMNSMKTLAKAYKPGTPLVMVVDSVAGLPSGDQSDDMNDPYQNMLLAQKWSRFMPGFVPLIRGKEIYVILLNQTRAEVNMFKRSGPSKITSGGRAINYYSSVRIELKSYKPTSDPAYKSRFDPEFCNILRADIRKNSVSPPNRHAVFPFFYYSSEENRIKRGVDDAISMMRYLKNAGSLKHTSGGWYEGLGQKLRYFDMRDWIRDNPENMQACKDEVTQLYLQYYS